MNKTRRQLFLLLGFMILLASVMLFLFVYAPEPMEAKSVGLPLPEPIKKGLDAVVDGYSALFSDLNNAKNVTNTG